jgi:hypothetical protein
MMNAPGNMKQQRQSLGMKTMAGWSSGRGRILRSRPNQDELDAFGVAAEHGETDGGGADFRGSPERYRRQGPAAANGGQRREQIPEREGEGREVRKDEEITVNMNPSLDWTGGNQGCRNLRRSVTAMEEKRRPCARFTVY